MQVLKILLLEDEDYTRKFIKKLVTESLIDFEIFDTAKGEEAIAIAREHCPHIALLDIELGENENLNGLEVAKFIKNISPKTEFVFITGYSKYALDSFSVHPYDYILKPIDIEKVINTLNALRNMIGLEKDSSISSGKVIVQNKNETIFIPLEEIIFIETQHRGTIIHCGDGIYPNSQILANIEKQLDKHFIKTHKSFIVNKNKIRKIKQIADRSYEIEFIKTDKTALMSRYRFQELKEHLIPS